MPNTSSMVESAVAGHRVVAWPAATCGMPLILLHGFTGRSESWRRVVEHLAPSVGASSGRRVVGVDLPGHHPWSPADAHGGWQGACDRLARVIGELGSEARHVVGYSMGARLALGLAARHPRRVARLTLIGVHPGLDDDEERGRRRGVEEAWARRLRRSGTEAFMREWERLPLFRSQSRLQEDVLREQALLRRSHDPEQLAAGLELLGLSAMPNHWPALERMERPVDLMAGSRDAKFVAMARRAAARLPQGTCRVVDGAGHNVTLEAPAAVAGRLRDEGT